MKIGIFGGSFNPPHKMHIKIAEYLLENNYVNKVIFVPTGSKYKYKNNLELDIDRYNMLNLAITNNNFEVSKYELKNHVVYTYQTLDYFKNKYPLDEIFFICGADNLSYIETWKNAEYILNNFFIIVINRKNNDINSIISNLKEFNNNIIVCDLEMNDVSSTLIRNKIKSNEDVTDYLDDKVSNYIKKRHLYKK